MEQYSNPILTGAMQMSNAGMKINPCADLKGDGGSIFPFPGMNNTEIGTVDPIMQGFQDSEFRKKANNMQQDAVYFKYKGKDMQMNSSMAGALRQYLESIGKGDLYDSGLQLSGPLQQVGIDDQLNATDPGPLGPNVGNEIAVPSTGIQGLQQYQNPYQNNNNNMSNFKNMEKLLQNIDGGIQSLIDNSSMQKNISSSQFPFANSGSSGFMGGDILKWSSY